MWHIVICRWGMYSQCAEKGTGFLHYFSVQILRLLIWSTVDKAKKYLCSKSFSYEPTQVPMKMMVMLCRHSYWLIIDSQVNAFSTTLLILQWHVILNNCSCTISTKTTLWKQTLWSKCPHSMALPDTLSNPKQPSEHVLNILTSNSWNTLSYFLLLYMVLDHQNQQVHWIGNLRSELKILWWRWALPVCVIIPTSPQLWMAKATIINKLKWHISEAILGEGRKWTLQTGGLLILSKSLELGGEAFNVLGFNSHYKPHLPQPLCLCAIVIHCTNLRRLGKRWQICNQSTWLISATHAILLLCKKTSSILRS